MQLNRISNQHPGLGIARQQPMPRPLGLRALTFRSQDFYKNDYLEGMFDQMGPHYETVFKLGGLGFYGWWQRRAIRKLELQPGDKVCDLMSGTGDAWKHILPKIGPTGQIVAVDLSQEMIRRSQRQKAKLKADNIRILKEDVLHSSIPTGSMDKVLSSYGVKTLPAEKYPDFVKEVRRILKPGGKFSILEVSLPENKWHQSVYRLYMKVGFFMLRRVLKKDAERFAMISRYMEDFKNCKALQQAFEKQGMTVQYIRMPGDGGTAIVGKTPQTPEPLKL